MQASHHQKKSLESGPSEEQRFSIRILAVCISSLEDRNRDAHIFACTIGNPVGETPRHALLRVDERLLNPLLCWYIKKSNLIIVLVSSPFCSRTPRLINLHH